MTVSPMARRRAGRRRQTRWARPSRSSSVAWRCRKQKAAVFWAERQRIRKQRHQSLAECCVCVCCAALGVRVLSVCVCVSCMLRVCVACPCAVFYALLLRLT